MPLRHTKPPQLLFTPIQNIQFLIKTTLIWEVFNFEMNIVKKAVTIIEVLKS